MSDYLYHHGIKGQKWGKRNGPPYPLDDTKGLNDILRSVKDISYDNTEHGLKSHAKVLADKTGNCHDQTKFIIDLLRANGENPKGFFVMEVNPKTGQGGMTHSFPYISKNNIYWIENAWNGNKGIHEFNNMQSVKKYLETQHKTGSFGNSDQYSALLFGDFDVDVLKDGDSLQEIVDKCLS